ncbi:unnamed protein product [Mucor hiemalis]
MRVFNSNYRISLTEELLVFHEFNRTKEEIQFLKMEATRFLENLKDELQGTSIAIDELNSKDDLTGIEDGRLSFLSNKHRRLHYAHELAKDYLLSEDVLNEEDDDEDGDDEEEVEEVKDNDNEYIVSEIIADDNLNEV